MKCIVSRPNHANLFAAFDRRNPFGLTTHGHDELQDGTSFPFYHPGQAFLGKKSRTSPKEPSSLLLIDFRSLDASFWNYLCSWYVLLCTHHCFPCHDCSSTFSSSHWLVEDYLCVWISYPTSELRVDCVHIVMYATICSIGWLSYTIHVHLLSKCFENPSVTTDPLRAIVT